MTGDYGYEDAWFNPGWSAQSSTLPRYQGPPGGANNLVPIGITGVPITGNFADQYGGVLGILQFSPSVRQVIVADGQVNTMFIMEKFPVYLQQGVMPPYIALPSPDVTIYKKSKLTVALTTTTNGTTQLLVSPIGNDIPGGSNVVVSSGSNSQVFVTTQPARAGATIISVTTATAAFAFPVGSLVAFDSPMGPGGITNPDEWSWTISGRVGPTAVEWVVNLPVPPGVTSIDLNSPDFVLVSGGMSPNVTRFIYNGGNAGGE